MAAAAYKTMRKLWIRRDKIGLGRRMRLYNAYILPVLTYNATTWGLSEKAEKRLIIYIPSPTASKHPGDPMATENIEQITIRNNRGGTN